MFDQAFTTLNVRGNQVSNNDTKQRKYQAILIYWTVFHSVFEKYLQSGNLREATAVFFHRSLRMFEGFCEVCNYIKINPHALPLVFFL